MNEREEKGGAASLLRDMCGATSRLAAGSHLTCPTSGDAWAPVIPNITPHQLAGLGTST